MPKTNVEIGELYENDLEKLKKNVQNLAQYLPMSWQNSIIYHIPEVSHINLNIIKKNFRNLIQCLLFFRNAI